MAITAQKMKFSIKDFFSKFYQIPSFLRIWSHLLKKPLMINFIFCAVHMSSEKLFLTGVWSLCLPYMSEVKTTEKHSVKIFRHNRLNNLSHPLRPDPV